MIAKAAVALAVLLPLVICQPFNNTQIYFPDDAKFAPALSGFAVAAPASSNSFVDFRRSGTVYEQYVDQLIARGVAKLTLAINKAYQEDAENDNIVFAPLNLVGALALVLLGSNGKTFQELSTALGLAAGLEIESRSQQVHEQLGRMIKKVESSTEIATGQQINFAEAVFIQNSYPIRKLYKETAEILYQSEVLNVDFQSDSTKATQVVNAWVSHRTNGKIKDILSDAPSSTKVVIASAMYFKAEWEKPFMEEATARRDFYPDGRKTKTSILVDMMANAGEFPYYKDTNLQAEILGLPYKGNATMMYIVMPFNSNQQKLKEFESSITENDLENLAKSTVNTKCQMLVPKMKIETTLHLKPILQKLGVTSLFNPSEANLGLLSPGVGSIPTKTDSEVNPLAPFHGNPNEVLIFSRNGDTVNCSAIFDPTNNVTTCQDAENVKYKRFGDKVGRRILRSVSESQNTIDSLRTLINQQSTDNHYQNPGLFADDVIHKVYIDITETGTEGAASTLMSLYRTSFGVTFRVDVPFLFFIRHEETKTLMFWGSVYRPTPNYSKG